MKDIEKDFAFLSIKDVMNLTGTCRTTAYRLRKDIGKEYDIPASMVTYYHFKKYLKLY